MMTAQEWAIASIIAALIAVFMAGISTGVALKMTGYL